VDKNLVFSLSPRVIVGVCLLSASSGRADERANEEQRMSKPLANVRVAILMTDGTDKTEFSDTREALAGAGATISVVSPKEHWVSGAAEKARLMDFPGWGPARCASP
jgi:hypothetical protein